MRSPTLRLVLASGLTLGSLLACSTESAEPGGSTDSDHTAGEYIQQNHPLYWTDSSFEDFRRVSEAGAWSRNPDPAGADDIAQAWLQAWTDRIHDIVRAKVKEDTGQELVAPSPTMHLLPSTSISNAWVTSVEACVPWKIRAQGFEGSSAPPDENLVLLFNHYYGNVSALSHDFTSGPDCIDRPDFEEHRELFLKNWNAAVPQCQGELVDGVIEVPQECVAGISTASRAAVYSVSPHVQFASDLLAAGSEAGAVFVVAHELAHYYRAHGSPLARHKYGFWYDQDPKKARRPVESKQAEELAQLYQEVLELPQANSLVLPGATYSPRFRAVALTHLCRFVNDTIMEVGDPEKFDGSCLELQRECDAVAPLTWSSVADEYQLAQYLKLEKDLPVCANTLTVGSVTEYSVATLVNGLQNGRYLPPGPAEDVPLPENFGALVREVEAKAVAADEKVAKFAERLRLGHIGLYTTEQEADELALEWVNLLGFNTDEAINGWLDYLDYFEKWGPPYGEPSASECRQLYKSNFKDGRAFTTVFLGDLNSAHHAGCYRVYNLWREQRAHRYETSELKRPEGPSWEEVLEHAKKLSAY